jgi:hypothetical protein
MVGNSVSSGWTPKTPQTAKRASIVGAPYDTTVNTEEKFQLEGHPLGRAATRKLSSL